VRPLKERGATTDLVPNVDARNDERLADPRARAERREPDSEARGRATNAAVGIAIALLGCAWLTLLVWLALLIVRVV
jgi:hypothetical protein